MIEVFNQNPLLLLFFVSAIGYLLGSIKIAGSKLGVAGVLFVGLAIGGVNPSLEIPEIILFLGLSIFVYTIGISSGPSFFAVFKGKNLKPVYFILFMFTFYAVVAIGVFYLFNFSTAMLAGIYAGSGTSTSALAGVLNAISSESSASKVLLNESVVGFSLAYPFGVIGVMVALVITERLLRVNLQKEAESLSELYPLDQELSNGTFKISNEEMVGVALRDLRRKYKLKVVFGRIKRDGKVSLTNWDTVFEKGDLVRCAGLEKEMQRTATLFGSVISNGFTDAAAIYIDKRIFVSNPDVTGQPLASLNINERYAAQFTRVRRGDSDLLATGNTVLELGDQVRFIARMKDVPSLVKIFGDSYQALSHINLFSFGIGMALGLLLGMITFSLPGGLNFQLGYAGGPLIAGLLLGAARRTGPILWTLPYGANLTLRQISLIFLLATIGVRSGHTFFSTISQGGVWPILLAAFILSVLATMIIAMIGYKFFKIPYTMLYGMMSNQPAILDFAINRTKNQLPTVTYALMFPFGLIVKIIYAQALFLLLS